MAETTPLESEIRHRIEAAGPMPIGEYMALCLFDPVHGYYTTRDPLGAGGDFITAPEISQMFGELIGLWMASCFITPGADPYSPLILGVAFTVLFFVSAGLVRFVRPVSEADPIQIASAGVEVSRRGAVERVA